MNQQDMILVVMPGWVVCSECTTMCLPQGSGEGFRREHSWHTVVERHRSDDDKLETGGTWMAHHDLPQP